MCFLTRIPLFRSVSENLHCVQVRRIGSLSAVRTTVPSCPDAHLSTVPSVRTTCHIVRTPDRPSIIRPDDVYFRPDPSLYQEASVLACICPGDSAARPDALQYSIKLPILSKIIYGKIAATVRMTWISIRTRFSLRQESQFKRRSVSMVRTRVQQIWKLRIRLQPSGRLPFMVRTRAQ
jgi:hypothetical protein